MAVLRGRRVSEVFACDEAGELVKARVTQCALSRICGVCGRSLGRPVHLVGTPAERDRAAFHFPPVHAECVPRVPVDGPVETVVTSGFEFVRPERSWTDRRPVFSPNSVLPTPGRS